MSHARSQCLRLVTIVGKVSIVLMSIVKVQLLQWFATIGGTGTKKGKEYVRNRYHREDGDWRRKEAEKQVKQYCDVPHLDMPGVHFVPACLSRKSKVFEWFYISEASEKSVCLCCHKILQGINTSNWKEHLLWMHNSSRFPEIQAYLKTIEVAKDQSVKQRYQLRMCDLDFRSFVF